ncbi:MAG TPA: PAS domain-containing sensor histidine kinase [Chitinophagaceae bacterium]|nr:PAS domain-containing sensor histidine kinase [Chitinophagaceae bacterium]
MFRERPLIILVFCCIVMLATAVLQYIDPGSPFYDGGLMVAIIITVLLKEDWYTRLFGAIAILLVVISGFYPHENVTTQQVVVQHLFAAIIIVVTIIAVLYVKKLYRSIESDQTQTNALFEHATEGMILTNSKGEIILINPAALNLFHFTKEELLGKSIEVLIPARLHGMHEKYRDSFYRAPSNRSMGHGRDLRAKTKDGSEFPVEVSLSYYKQKNEFFVIAFIVDITARKQYEQELIQRKEQLENITADIRLLNAELENKVEERTMILKEALQQLEISQEELNLALNKEKELNEIKSKFVSMASHEFRTPLSTVLSSAALIGKYTKEEEQPQRDRHIKRIKESVKHLNDLLEDFLSLGKLEEGKVKVAFTKFNAKEFIAEITEEMKPVLKSGQHITYLPGGNNWFTTDKRLVKNILINLLANASKFSGEGAEIKLVEECKDNQLVISVHDNGIGISAEDQLHLFSSFYRGNNAANIPGTGLGLHIVKRYTGLINGTIEVDSVIGEGTTFTVTLPEQESSAEQVEN